MNRFSIDTLEPRQMFANVGVQLSGGLLQVAGTASADNVALLVSGEQLIVKAGAGTTINGAASKAFPRFSVTSISATLGAGSDSMTLDGVNQGLGGTIDAGDGADIVNLYRSTLHGMLIQGKGGNDLVNVLSTTMQSVIVDAGAGNDWVNILDNTVFNFSSVVMGDGDDLFVAVKNTVFGFTSVDGGAGRDVALGLWNNLPGGSFVTGFEFRLGL